MTRSSIDAIPLMPLPRSPTDMAPTTTTSSIPAPAQDATESSTSFLDDRSTEPQFTLRAVLAGLVIGVLIAFSNTYFGLQTGWISGMAMPSALIGFAYFKGLRTLTGALGGVVARAGFGEGFSEVENVLVQTVAGSVGTMPLGCGFVGVIPALEFLLAKDEAPEGGLSLSLAKLVVWALGLCFFGVMFAVPLRKEVIIREKLRFPSGTATALMIGVLHGGEKTGVDGEVENAARRRKNRTGTRDEESQALMASSLTSTHETAPRDSAEEEHQDRELALKRDWKKQIRLLTTCFGISGVYVRLRPPESSIANPQPSTDHSSPHRHSSLTSSLKSTTSPSWARTFRPSGSGASTRPPPTSARASSWAPPRPCTCSSAPSSAGPS